MTYFRTPLSALFIAAATTATAEVPTVVTDFVPTTSIVNRVMQGLGTSISLLLPNDTPHHFAMRPSHAQLLTDADMVIWVGADLTPWLAEPIETLAPKAQSLALLETDGWENLPMREGHGHGDHGDHDDDHSDHDNHGDDHGDHEDHDDHAADHHGAAHDPHAWLDPDIAAVWALNIAEALSAADAANAVVYQTNANQFWADAALLGQEIETAIANLDGSKILLPHDSLQYFEKRFGLETAGYIAKGDAADPGPAHLRELKDRIEAGEITCILGDVETNPGTLTLLTEGTEAKTGTLDLTDRKSVGYVEMMKAIVTTLTDCAT